MGIISKQLLKVIENTDTRANTIAWRFPMNDRVEIMNGSRLIVRDGQVAVFVKEGRVADIFAPGQYKLETKNLPFLTQLMHWNKGFNSPFKAEVYYVTTTQFNGQKWGTSSPLTVNDSKIGSGVPVRAFGTYAYKINDAKLFLMELLGSKSEFTTDKIQDHLRSIIVSSMTDVIASSKFGVFDLSSKLTEFNEIAKTSLQSKFNALGMTLVTMVVESINFPAEIQEMINKRAGVGIMADKMGSYVQMQQAEALREAAKNPGMVGTFVGMGMMGNMMGGGVAGGGMAAMNNARDGSRFCNKCGSAVKPGAKFCADCGAKLVDEGNCSKCGHAVKPGAKFCPECGNKM